MPEQLISDAVLTYQLQETDNSTSICYRLIELDRANRPAADLAARLARYARLNQRPNPSKASGEPPYLWMRLYPVFPAVLVVLAGAGRQRLLRRRETLTALCRQDPELQQALEAQISICLLEDLLQQGPFAPIFHNPEHPDSPRDWLGQEESEL